MFVSTTLVNQLRVANSSSYMDAPTPTTIANIAVIAITQRGACKRGFTPANSGL